MIHYSIDITRDDDDNMTMTTWGIDTAQDQRWVMEMLEIMLQQWRDGIPRQTTALYWDNFGDC